MTTGFYHLNFQINENNLINQSIIDCYEREIDKIVETANQILEKYINENPQHREVQEISNAYRAFKQDFEQQRSSSIEEYHQYISNLEREHQQLKEEIKYVGCSSKGSR